MVTPASTSTHPLFAWNWNQKIRLLVLWMLVCLSPGISAAECIGWVDLKSFAEERNASGTQRVWTSPVTTARQPFRELVLSWNVELPAGASAEFEARAGDEGAPGQFYHLGEWSGQARPGGRKSVKGQKDDFAEVQTDTLVFKRDVKKFQIRMRITGLEGSSPRLKLLTASLAGSQSSSDQGSGTVAPAPHQLDAVPLLCQLDYQGGEVWCSPTSVTMILQHWSRVLGRPDLDVRVPDVVTELFDPNWPGTGNWSFNVAYAGSFPGMRAYATRLNSLEELASWTAAGIPVATSVCYNKLRGIEGRSSGHLVVCIGFDKNGDVILNDPGSRTQGRRTVARDRFLDAWSHSQKLVYLIHPEKVAIPEPPNRSWLPGRKQAAN